MRVATDWFADNLFWEKMRDAVFRAERMDAARDEASNIMAMLGLAGRVAGVHGHPGDFVLDLPCGVGRHAVELAKCHVNVTGVDRYQPYLVEAEKAASAQNVQLELIREDMRKFVREAYFDAVINMYTSFGYFESHADEMRTLSNFFQSLKPGGQLLMEMAGKEVIAMNFQKRAWFPIDDRGSVVLEEREIVDHWRRIRTRWTYFPANSNDRFERTSDIRMFSAGELIMMLEQTGFVDCQVFGTLKGAPYDNKAKRLIVKARKPI